MYIDTHCHLDDKAFTDIDSTVEKYLRSSVDTVINAGCDLNSSLNGKILSEKYKSVYFFAGFHPEFADGFLKNQSENLKTLSALAKNEKCLGIGEIGLDYHYDGFDKEKQKAAFIAELKLAEESGLPVSIHSRDATEDTYKILCEYAPREKGVLHCFSGSVETAKLYLEKGFYIAFGGTLTFKNSVRLKEVAKAVPLDRILTETDSPYLSPEPFRGKMNSPENIPIITAFIANVKGIGLEETACAINENAKRLFKKLNA